MSVIQETHTEVLSPKERFQMSGTKLSNHRDLITREDFRIAIDTALLQFQYVTSAKVKDQYTGMHAGIAMQGALEFITVLRQLADKPSVVRTTTNDNLKPNP